MDWPIQEVARLTGTTSRTLRHYADIGLLEPSRIGSNGYRYYDQNSLTTLQRILLLRELGLGLPAIGKVLVGQVRNSDALLDHLSWLQSEKDRLDRQIGAVETTIMKMGNGEQLMAKEMFDGFDHTQYKDEVEERWGKDAYAKSDAWWRGLSENQKQDAKKLVEDLGLAWTDAAARDLDPSGAQAQELAQRHFDWLRGIPGTPGGATGPTKAYFLGLADMYVADARFGANYGGQQGAEFVRAAITVYAKRNL